MNYHNFFSELKRRNVYKVAAAYAVVGWLIVQVATQVFPFFEIPNWAVRLVVLLIIIGFPIALVIAWAFESSPKGIVRTMVADALNRHSRGRAWIYIVVIGALLSVALFLLGRCSARNFVTPQQDAIWARAHPGTDKSIAVLPFDNLSRDPDNPYFAEGVQDEILTDLAKVADLKVISRTSVTQYKNAAARNLREIAQQLGVAHLLEGSVQRAGGKVRVNAQLIDARSDAHLWAQTYDRDLADVFAIQSEIAKTIADQLQAKLSPREKAAIEELPTKDLVAYEIYARAKTLIEDAVFSAPQNESLFEAVRLLNQAIERDPAFALAYYQLGRAHDLIYFVGADHTPARLAMADAAIQSLNRLRPSSGEAHLALAWHFYLGYHSYDRAREELDLAQQGLPNDPALPLLAGYIDRRQGRWAESTKNLERAAELDPQNTNVLQQTARSYECLRRYADEERALDPAIALTPKDAALRASRAQIELSWHADLRPLISTMGAILAEDSREAKNIAATWLQVSLCVRDFDSARRALAALPIAGCQQETIPFPQAWCEGIVAQMRGDKAEA